MNIKLLDFKPLKNFTSGAGIEFYDDHLYVIGEDARYIMVMNKDWKIQETINLSASGTFRLANDSNSVFEATTILSINKIPFILMIGSGSIEGSSNKAFLMNLNTRGIEEVDLSVFYNRLKSSGLPDLDIEAVTVMNDKLILCNRGNKSQPFNHIIITSLDFWKNQYMADILAIKIELETKPGKYLALTGLTYSYKNDWFITTVSSEDFNNDIDDGTSRESFIGVVENASRKIGRKRFKINEYFNLQELNKKFQGHQIKSLCFQADKDHRLKLHMAGTNEMGETSLFKIRLKE